MTTTTTELTGSGAAPDTAPAPAAKRRGGGGGLGTYLIIRFRLMPLPQFLAESEWARRLHRMDAGVPYGIALAAAALLVYPETSWMAFH